MKIYVRNARFWEEVHTAFLHRAHTWTKGSEGRALLAIAASEEWLAIFTEHAPASPRVSPQECAAVILYRLLS